MERPAEIAIIAAVARNGAIGRGNALLFDEPADQRHFRATTLGYPVIMGRKTWDSLPPRFRPLPGRRNVVVSRSASTQAAGAEVASSLEQALALVADAPRAFVIGGAELYAQALPLAHTLVLTEIDADLDGDAFFPVWDRSLFEETSSTTAVTAAGVPYRFVTYSRHGGAQPHPT
ncbi:MAG: dihydrofolate reductase [Rubrivivax sp.]|nr:dihydrofolate reductase [Rubrivivax sp.]